MSSDRKNLKRSLTLDNGSSINALSPDELDMVGKFIQPPNPSHRILDTGDPEFQTNVDDILMKERRNRLRIGFLKLIFSRSVGLVTDDNAEALVRLLTRLSSSL